MIVFVELRSKLYSHWMLDSEKETWKVKGVKQKLVVTNNNIY